MSSPYVVGAFLIGGLIAWAAVDARLIEPRRLKLERIEIPIDNLPDAFDGYRIALLSDLHYPRLEADFIARAIDLANSFEPDLVTIPGDLCDKYRTQPSNAPDFTGMFDALRAPDGIVGTLGNHDNWLDVKGIRREIARNTPIQLIEQQSILIEREGQKIAIGGVGDLDTDVAEPEMAFENVPAGIPRILLSHNPDLADLIDRDLHIDLMLSGHTHGGQINVPLLPALWMGSRFGIKFRAGLVQGKGCRVYVSRGLYSARHLRFRCLPEVTGITLKKARS